MPRSSPEREEMSRCSDKEELSRRNHQREGVPRRGSGEVALRSSPDQAAAMINGPDEEKVMRIGAVGHRHLI